MKLESEYDGGDAALVGLPLTRLDLHPSLHMTKLLKQREAKDGITAGRTLNAVAK